MKRIFCFFVLIAATLFASEESDRLAAVMNDANASIFAKTLACKQAAQNGTRDSAAVLAPFLDDETLSHPARIALERIPDPAAGVALRDSLSKVQGKLLVGVLESLGERKEPEAAAGIAPMLESTDKQVVYAAAVALGKIGTPDALVSLQTAFGKSPADRKALLVDGLYGCAESLNVAGKSADAQKVYASVRSQADLSGIVRSGAVRGEVLTAGTETPMQLNTLLADPDDTIFAAALEASREITVTTATQALLAVLPRLSEERQVPTLAALGDRADAAARPLLLDWANNKTAIPVKNAAIQALFSVPDNTVIDALFELLHSTDPSVVNATVDAFKRMQYPDLDAMIVQRLTQAQGKKIIPLAAVCRKRKIGPATPVLLPLLKDPDIEVRRATLDALGYTVSGEDVNILVDRLLHPDSKIEFDTVLGSLQVVCARTVDQDAVASLLAKDYESAPLDTQCEILKLLRFLGGGVAIETVRKGTENPTEKIQDVATQVLGDWPDTEAAPVLLDVVKKEGGNPKFQIRALRGYIRIVRQMDTSPQHRYKMTLDALAVAQREEEKLLLIDALGRIPLAESLKKLAEMIETPPFTEPVCSSLVNAAKPIVTQQREAVLQAMQLVEEKSKNADTVRVAKETAAAVKQ